ncbi:hypothetical protein ACJMK2_023936 [Sinanodonta woodiana]|uniref:Uncharacterized protein n=1 Tax=Sinanodonta woodiana TaxID=1069815 RepID=A0ABD3T7D3_SINWO
MAVNCSGQNNLDNDLLDVEGPVSEECHIKVATKVQFTLLRQAHRWYMDSICQGVNNAFAQLFSIHAFLNYGVMIQVLKKIVTGRGSG